MEAADRRRADITRGFATTRRRWARLRHEWDKRLEPGEQATVLAWASFTFTFAGLRGLTHWIRAGHGPSGGGIKLGGKHFHHYNIGIGMLATVAAVGLRGTERQRRHPAAAVAFGAANAMIVDELALLLDLKDVYWARRWPRERRRRGRPHRQPAARSSPACRSGRTPQRALRSGSDASRAARRLKPSRSPPARRRRSRTAVGSARRIRSWWPGFRRR